MDHRQRASIVAVGLAALLGVQPVLAAGGWYLLIPPHNERSPVKILEGEPLSKWTQQGAYDSASECEATRAALLRVEQNSFSDAQRRLGLAMERKDRAAIAVTQHMRPTRPTMTVCRSVVASRLTIRGSGNELTDNMKRLRYPSRRAQSLD